MKRYIKSLLVSAVAIFFTFSCVITEDLPDPQPPQEDTDVDVVLRLQTPGSYAGSRSRALTLEQENAVSTVHVLVLKSAGGAGIDDDVLVTIEEGETDGSNSQFTVTLPYSNNRQSRNLVVLANLDQNSIATTLPSFTPEVTTYAQMRAALTVSTSAKMYASGTGSIPLYGETGYITISPTGSYPAINLLRAVARIDVGLGTGTQDAETGLWSWDGKRGDGTDIPFVMTDIYVMRSSDRYAIIPSAVTSGKVSEPTIPAGADTNAQLIYTDAAGEITDGVYSTQHIYVPEALVDNGEVNDANHPVRMALIIGGYYDGGGTKSYYRVDFLDSGNNLLNVLRNHLYLFHIADVVGPGALSAEDANSAASSNMRVEVVEWSEIVFEQMLVRGNLGFNATQTSPIEFGALKDETTTVEFVTNVSGFEMLFGAEVMPRLTSEGSTTSTTYFDYALVKGATAANGYTTYALTIKTRQDNFGSTNTPRTDTWSLEIGDIWKLEFKATQTSAATDPTKRAVVIDAQYTATAGDMGSAMATVGRAAVGESVTVSATPREGYVFAGWTATDITLEDEYANPVTFDMPAVSVSLTARFEPQAAVYVITVTGNDSQGEAQANYTSAIEGTVVTLLASPKSGYKFNGWSVTSGGVTLSNALDNPATFTVLTSDVEIAASFLYDPGSLTGGDYSITVTSAHGSAIASPTNADQNDPVTLMATPSPGYRFLSWSNPVNAVWSSGSNTSSNPATIIVGSGNVTVTANYSQLFGVNFGTLTNGTASAGSTEAAGGDEVTVTATAMPGYIFTGWSSPQSVSFTGFNPASFTMLSQAVTIEAAFARQTEPLSVVSNNDSWGGVSATPATPTQGQIVSLSINTVTGYEFTGFTVIHGGTPAITAADIVAGAFTMPSGQVSIRANFAPVDRTITVAAATAQGSATVTTNAGTAASGNSTTAKAGERVTISATAAGGYVFDGWSTSGTTVTPAPARTNPSSFIVPAGNVTVTPQFAQVFTPQVTTTNGSYTTSKPYAKANETITLTAAPDDGYKFISWSFTAANGASFTTATDKPTITLQMGTAQSADPVIVATFDLATAPPTPRTITAAPGTPAGSGIVTITTAAGTATSTISSTATTSSYGGEYVALEATASPGWIFDGWVPSGTAVTPPPAAANPSGFVMPDGDVTITPRFTKLYTPVITATNGSVTMSPTSAPAGKTMVLTASANAGFRFTGWTVTSDGGGAYLSSQVDSSVTLTMGTTQSSNPAITAHYDYLLEGFAFPVEAEVRSISYDGIESGAAGGNAYVTLNGGTEHISQAEPTTWIDFHAEENVGWIWEGWTVRNNAEYPYNFGDLEMNTSRILQNIMMPNRSLSLVANFQQLPPEYLGHNGLLWRNADLGSSGTFNDDATKIGTAFSYNDRRTACPSGWRTPRSSEVATLMAALSDPVDHGTYTSYAVHGTNVRWVTPNSSIYLTYDTTVTRMETTTHPYSQRYKFSNVWQRASWTYFYRPGDYKDPYMQESVWPLKAMQVRCVEALE